MKANIQAQELKRIQRNAYRRNWYAQLSESKKEAARQKQKAKYMENKKKQSLEPARSLLETAQTQKTFTRYGMNFVENAFNATEASSYANKGVVIRDMADSGHMCERKHVPPTPTVSFKGKEPIGSEASFHIGPQSLSATSVVHTLNQISPLQRDMTVPQTHSGEATTSITGCEAEHINMEIEATQLREAIYHRTSLNTGKRSKSTKGIGLGKSVDNILKTIPDKSLTLPTVQPCKYCAAKRFYHEPPAFCCSKGEVKLVSNAIPDELYDLYTSQTEKSDTFRTYIRTYNNTFAFTSFGVKYDKNLCKRNKGIYTFKIQGQVYHYINEILPTDNDPSYLQLYFYDMEHEIENRTAQSNKLQTSIVKELVDILQINPYAIFFRSLTNINDWVDQHIIIRKDASLDQRVFNSPSSSQIAAIWLENTESFDRRSRDITVYNHCGFKHKVECYYGCYDPLQYPLLFPFGETGWHQEIKRLDRQNDDQCEGQFLVHPNSMKSADQIIEKEKKVLSNAKKNTRGVSCREYYCFKLQIRPGEKSILLQAGRLLQQYAVDMYVKIETCRLDYFRNNQDDIRGEIYQGIKDSIASGETRGSKIGKRIVLPSSFTGGPRDMRSRYVDAMTLVQKFGKPDLLLTMTCNPNWPEIKAELRSGEESQNRPDLCARIFKSKFELLKEDVIKKEILGPIAAYTYVIEYQKRGLPHAHIALIFKKEAKLLSPDSYDNIVNAEIPDKDIHPHLYEMVVKHMMHGPCGVKNPQNVCMQRDGHCKNHYPKTFCSTTTQGNDSYPIYRRRDDGKQVKVRKHMLDNRWVVPYNPYLLAKYDCHINVEVCSSFKVVKYLYKYIYKGHDQIAFNITNNGNSNDEDCKIIDEIHCFQSARWISAVEAMWRIYGFDMNEMRPPVHSLHLHLEGKQLVTFRKYDKLENIVKRPGSTATMLTEYFHYNKTHENDVKYLYKEFPEHFVWDGQAKIWKKRKRSYAIGRIITANPSEGERYYLRLLLNHIKGPSSFEHLRTFNNHTVPTFREAALLHGLLENDNFLEKCLEEATSYQMPETLRRLFATILVYCTPNDPKKLWTNFKHAMIEDYKRLYSNDIDNRACIKALRNINSKLESMGKKLRDYSLTENNSTYTENSSKEIEDELNLVITDEEKNTPSTLNPQQKYAYDIITERVFSRKKGAFFIDGPGGTGKTYLYCALLATVRSKGMIALATATSGVAASILPGGRTAHSRFKIPLNIDENTTCNISKQTGLAKLIRATRLIVWDEASMARRQLIEAFDNMLQDINDCALPFGGKVVVFGGDFRQILPVVSKASREETVDATLLKSRFWPILEKIRLTENMRAKLDSPFSNFLLRIGNGTEQIISDGKIVIPPNMLLPYLPNDLDSIKSLTQHVFPHLQQYGCNPKLMNYRAILTPTNDYVDDINNLLITAFPGNATEYKSFDKTKDESEQGQHEDFLNSLTPKGLPPHILTLKPNCPIILLRNIDPPQGLSNGTRLICRTLTSNLIYAEIATGSHEGRKVFLPRIPLEPSDGKYPIPFVRKQFPVRLCFAMTINKAQGQTLETVGLYLPRPVFSHGQLYVALSRARTSNAIKIAIKPTYDDKSDYNCTENVVFREVLALAGI